MARKPHSMYHNITGQAYTRREYMRGIPANRIIQYDMGNRRGKFPVKISLIAKEKCQISHRALEAARITANRKLHRTIGEMGYHFKVRIYPHNVLRENKQATGAGADRVSQGMRSAFGKAVGTAARVKKGQKLLTVYTSRQHINAATKSLRSAIFKMPTPCSVIVENG